MSFFRSTHERLVNNVERAEARVVEATMADAIKFDNAMARAERKSARRQERIAKYERYAESARKALAQYEALEAQYAAKHHPKVSRMAPKATATA